MKENFDKCLEMLLEHEGGYVNDPMDNGGMTNLGVTRRVYEDWMDRPVTEQEMRDLTPDDVAPIYARTTPTLFALMTFHRAWIGRFWTGVLILEKVDHLSSTTCCRCYSRRSHR